MFIFLLIIRVDVLDLGVLRSWVPGSLALLSAVDELSRLLMGTTRIDDRLELSRSGELMRKENGLQRRQKDGQDK